MLPDRLFFVSRLEFFERPHQQTVLGEVFFDLCDGVFSPVKLCRERADRQYRRSTKRHRGTYVY